MQNQLNFNCLLTKVNFLVEIMDEESNALQKVFEYAQAIRENDR